MVGQVCEGFGCVPTRALWELTHDPDGMAIQILKLRAYAETKRAWDRDPEDVPDGPMKRLVQEFSMGPGSKAYEIYQRKKREAAERKKAKQGKKD